MTNVSWTVEYTLNIKTSDIKWMLHNAHFAIGCGDSVDNAVHTVVTNYLVRQGGGIYTIITEEARDEIEEIVRQRLKKHIKT